MPRSRPSPLGARTAVVLVLVAASLYAGRGILPFGPPARTGGTAEGSARVADLFAEGTSGEMVEVSGKIDRRLADDRDGSPHQRFIVVLSSGQTLLVAHDLDLADRVPIEEGDEVQVRGQYEWNDRGGVLHWTHHDPRGTRPGGWIEHAGVRYR